MARPVCTTTYPLRDSIQTLRLRVLSRWAVEGWTGAGLTSVSHGDGPSTPMYGQGLVVAIRGPVWPSSPRHSQSLAVAGWVWTCRWRTPTGQRVRHAIGCAAGLVRVARRTLTPAATPPAARAAVPVPPALRRRGGGRFPARWPGPGRSRRVVRCRARSAETHGPCRRR